MRDGLNSTVFSLFSHSRARALCVAALCLVYLLAGSSAAQAQADLGLRLSNGSVVPSSVEAGSTIGISGTVLIANSGTLYTPKTGFYVGAYLGDSSFSLRSRKELAEELLQVYLAPGESYKGTVSYKATIPVTTAAGTYYVWIWVDSSGLITEPDETDNFASVGTVVVTAAKPDLWISSGTPSVTPTSVVPGGTVSLSGWTVKNQGRIASGDFSNGFYLSADSTITAADTYLTGNSNVSLAAGESFTWGGPTLTIPAATALGSYYIGILVDRGGAVSESNESNNYVSVPLTVAAAAQPDLVISVPEYKITSPVEAGGTARLTATRVVENRGKAATPRAGFSIGVYLSLTTELPLRATPLAETAVTDIVPAGGSLKGTATFELPIPAATSPNRYYLLAFVDNRRDVAESDETNNVATIGTITVIAPSPDLAISSGTPSVTPASVVPGGTVTLSAWTVRNQGTASAGAFSNGFYLSTDSTITSADTYLDGNSNTSLAAGESFAWGGPKLTIPAATPTGNYYIGILVDRGGDISESSETNNYVSVPLTVATAAQPDLVIAVPEYKVTSPVEAGSTARLSFNWAVENRGKEDTPRTGFYIGVYLSLTTELPLRATPLAEAAVPDIVPAGGSLKGTAALELAIPAATVPDRYYLLAFVDNRRGVAESDETNNVATIGGIAVIAPRPDLTISSGTPTATPTSLAPGESLALSGWTVVNQGASTASAFKNGYFLSQDAVITSADTLLGGNSCEGLAVGASQSYDVVKLSIPAGTAGGDYYVGMLVDYGGGIAESNEGNNYVSTPIKVVLPTAPDLTISVLDFKYTPSPLEAGSPGKLSGSWMLKNQGTASTKTGFTIGLYLGTGELFSLRGATLLGEMPFPEPLDAGRSLEWSGTVALNVPGGIVPGRYWLFAVVDSRKEIVEQNELNNVAGMGPVAVTGPQADLWISSGSPTVTPESAPPGATVLLSKWTVQNQGAASSGAFGNGFYLSADPVITPQDLYLTGNSNTALAPGESFPWGGPKLTIPVSIRPGNYYLGILVDAGDTVQELNETNNYVSVPLTITSACNYAIEPTGQIHGSGSEAGRIAVMSGPECQWTTGSAVRWITIKEGTAGTGKGVVVYVVEANPTKDPRAGTIMVAGETFTVKQEGGVLPTISSINPSTVAAGSPGFDLTLDGSNFVVGSVVRWNNQPRATTSLGMSQLRAAILAADVINQGTVDVTVVNPWGGTSEAKKFVIGPPNNPLPVVRAISPVFKFAGSAGFKLTVVGTNFVAGSKVRWNGADRYTHFESPTLLTAAILANDVAKAGKASVTVFSPTPGGGTSQPVTLTVWPGICITDLSPNLAPLGRGAFKLTIFGDGLFTFQGAPATEAAELSGSGGAPRFAGTPQVLWNGQPLTTVVVDSSTVTATVPAGLVSAEGTALVSVSGSGGGTSSNAIPLPITLSKPAPLLSKLSPSRVAPASGSFTLTAEGTSFSEGAKILWNGQERPTVFVDSTKVTAAIPAADIAAAGESSVTVLNPTPGGGESNRQTMTYVPSLLYPRLVSKNAAAAGPDNSEYTGIAVVNLGAAESKLTVTAFDKSGNPLSGEGITNPASVPILPGQQLPIVDFQLFGANLASRDTTGWFKMESTNSGIFGFFLMFNQSLSILDGTDVSAITHADFIVPEIEDRGFTLVHVANPDVQTATVMFELYKSDGTLRAAGTPQTLGPNATLAEKAADLFPGVTAEASDYIRATSDRDVVLFEYLGSGDYVEGLNGLDAAGGATTLYCPQYVVGGSDWRTTLSIVNLDPNPGTVTLRFIGDDGQMIGEPVARSIAARGKLYLTEQNLFVNAAEELTQGFLEIKSDGVRLAGSVVFGDQGRVSFSSALPLESSLKKSVVFSQLASNDTYFTGLALLNPGSETAHATIEVFDQTGGLIVSATEEIPPLSRKSKLLTQYFPSLVGQNQSAGYVRVKSDLGMAGFALFGTHRLSALSAVPAQAVP